MLFSYIYKLTLYTVREKLAGLSTEFNTGCGEETQEKGLPAPQ